MAHRACSAVYLCPCLCLFFRVVAAARSRHRCQRQRDHSEYGAEPKPSMPAQWGKSRDATGDIHDSFLEVNGTCLVSSVTRETGRRVIETAAATVVPLEY